MKLSKNKREERELLDANLEEVNKVNAYLRKCAWMEFDFESIAENEIVMCGCVDQSWRNDSIKIHFYNPTFFSAVFNFQKADNKNFIEIVDDKDILERYNQMGVVTYGCQIFRVNTDEGITEELPVIIIAEKVSCEILKQIGECLG